MFTGLSAFPITPVLGDSLDEDALAGLIARAAQAGVDSLGVLGSTGGYAYLDRAQRARILEVAVDAAGEVPVLAGIGALRTDTVIDLARDAADRGAAGLLLAPVSYQPLTADEVFGLYQDVTAATDLPVVVYDNPGTTGFHFTDALYTRIAQLPGIAAIKVPPFTVNVAERVAQLRTAVPAHVHLGSSGDAAARGALEAGIDVWFSVIAGTLPEIAVALYRASRTDPDRAAHIDDALAPLWALFAERGSARVIAAIAEESGAVREAFLPRPLRKLAGADRDRVRAALAAIAGLR